MLSVEQFLTQSSVTDCERSLLLQGLLANGDICLLYNEIDKWRGQPPIEADPFQFNFLRRVVILLVQLVVLHQHHGDGQQSAKRKLHVFRCFRGLYAGPSGAG